ncbi:DUF3892 domain-containing protein [Bradyrhizobium sp. CCBAU 11357]|uniref:DUF3892 domain-containing protein n=1 Tax=Bradyrhizobium sp. CCBAU 11357 TaxID=1630808 RepID=UPI0023038038|nr:DUF3892 domain-containing protein [Bradyrhizobium sp. CCBAU 11357]
MGETPVTSRIRIQCINKTDRQNPHERIKNVVGVNSDGSRWKQSVDATIKEIENGVWEFYVEEEHKANVIVAVHNGHKYIKTRGAGGGGQNDVGGRQLLAYGLGPGRRDNEDAHRAEIVFGVADHVALADKALCDTDVFAVIISGDEVAADRVAVFEPEHAARDHLFLMREQVFGHGAPLQLNKAF